MDRKREVNVGSERINNERRTEREELHHYINCILNKRGKRERKRELQRVGECIY